MAAVLTVGLATNSSAQVVAGQGEPAAQSASVGLSAAQLLALADGARARQDFAMAETAYRALTQDRELEIRTEARFRLGMMFADNLKRYADAVGGKKALEAIQSTTVTGRVRAPDGRIGTFTQHFAPEASALVTTITLPRAS